MSAKPATVLRACEREAVVAAIGRERAGDEKYHLAERERDHDEVDALGAQADEPVSQANSADSDERDRQRDQASVMPCAPRMPTA